VIANEDVDLEVADPLFKGVVRAGSPKSHATERVSIPKSECNSSARLCNSSPRIKFMPSTASWRANA
jgi:hypothetical protein